MNGWTDERRQRQAQLIRRWSPWTRSTGPRTRAGMRRSSRNAYKGAWRPQIREMAADLRTLIQLRKDLGL